MAAGEYVSVSSQSDAEKVDLEFERQSLKDNADYEREELANIYKERGLTPELAVQVAEQLMEHDALAAHARDEIGITDVNQARPLQAAFSSAIAFTTGAALPLVIAWLAPLPQLIAMVALCSLVSLALLGWVCRAGRRSAANKSIC